MTEIPVADNLLCATPGPLVSSLNVVARKFHVEQFLRRVLGFLAKEWALLDWAKFPRLTEFSLVRHGKADIFSENLDPP